MLKKTIVILFTAALAVMIYGCGDSSSESTWTPPASSKPASSAPTPKEPSTTTTPSQSVSEEQGMTVPEYCDKMQDCYNRLIDAMDAACDAEAAGDLDAAKAACKQSRDAYNEVLNTTAPAEASEVDFRMREVSASMNLLTMFYEDATIAKSEGDTSRYNEDMGEILVVIEEVNANAQNLSAALKNLTASYQ